MSEQPSGDTRIPVKHYVRHGWDGNYCEPTVTVFHREVCARDDFVEKEPYIYQTGGDYSLFGKSTHYVPRQWIEVVEFVCIPDYDDGRVTVTAEFDGVRMDRCDSWCYECDTDDQISHVDE